MNLINGRNDKALFLHHKIEGIHRALQFLDNLRKKKNPVFNSFTTSTSVLISAFNSLDRKIKTISVRFHQVLTENALLIFFPCAMIFIMLVYEYVGID